MNPIPIPLTKGRITQTTGYWHEVQTPPHTYYLCRWRAKRPSLVPVVGDQVEIALQADQTGLITRINRRRNYFARFHPFKAQPEHVLAANLDQIVLVITFRDPKVPLGFVDRVLCAAEAQNLSVTLLWNKQDLLTKDEVRSQKQCIRRYHAIGYASYLCSAHDKASLKVLQKVLTQGVHLLCGFSGVGKSTLLNGLCPLAAQTTRPISTYHKKGTHTTSSARLFEYAADVALIDTPGIKTFGLCGVKQSGLAQLFLDIHAHASHCGFANCTHLHEPDCAVQQALAKGAISTARYQSYCNIYQSLSD